MDTSGNTSLLNAQRRKDHVSHFVLRLAFCKTEDLRRRFIKAESMLFRHRYEREDVDARAEFIKGQNFGWQEVSLMEKQKLSRELQACCKGEALKDFHKTEYVKVPWTAVPELISRRACFIKNGQAYVSHSDQLSFIQNAFVENLKSQLEATARMINRLDEDERLLPVLENLSMGFLAGVTSDYSSISGKGEKITAAMISDLARGHFPMCMKLLESQLKQTHHLKHFARLQLNLFLKGIGMSVEEATVFWRKGFSNVTDDKFNKEYLYNIKHGYGQVGGRKDYAPKSCVRILTEHPPGPGEAHGCPFRHYSQDNLQIALRQHMNIHDQRDLDDIMSSVKSGHYHLGCTKVFEITHRKYGVESGQGIGEPGEHVSVDHPNKYFDRSLELANTAKDEPGTIEQAPDQVEQTSQAQTHAPETESMHIDE